MLSKKYIGLFSGLIAFFIILLLPEPAGMSIAAKNAAAVVVIMSIWWIGNPRICHSISAAGFVPAV
jgi:sodium-dependent dicarboxylate transporter 2/3/5